MDQFFVSFLLLNEFVIMGIGLLLIVAGGVLAAMYIDVRITFRRVTYLWFIAGAGLALSLSQFMWTKVPAAADAGVLSLLVIAAMGAFAVFGVAIYYGSAARSKDVDGNTRRAWMGFVPLANLWLIFAQGRGQGDDTESPLHYTLGRFVFDPLLVIGALFVILMSRGLDKKLENSDIFDATESQTLITLIANAQTVEQSFAREAEIHRADLPTRIDEDMVLRNVEAQGKTLHFTYGLNFEIESLDPDFKTILAQENCASNLFGHEISRGGLIIITYRGPDGNIIQSYEITDKDCTV